jgi:hypothetical protein
MSDLEFEFGDLYLSANEYLDLIAKVAQDSEFFDNMDDKTWHPEDLYYNMSTITETVGQAIKHYMTFVNSRRLANVRGTRAEAIQKNIQDIMNEYQAANPERTQVFGGTVPSSAFGDNV